MLGTEGGGPRPLRAGCGNWHGPALSGTSGSEPGAAPFLGKMVVRIRPRKVAWRFRAAAAAAVAILIVQSLAVWTFSGLESEEEE
eukprot:g26013.t1